MYEGASVVDGPLLLLDEDDEGGDERSPGKDVNRGRIYDSVDGGGGGGGGCGGCGGGNQLCSDNRAKSAVTCRKGCRSTLDPTI